MKPSLPHYVTLLVCICLILFCLLDRTPVPRWWRIWLWCLLMFLIGIFISLFFV